MKVTRHRLNPPGLEDVAAVIQRSLRSNFEHASAAVVDCPDLRKEPFCLAAEGISGDEKVADIGGQPNLFPAPKLSARYSLTDIAEKMDMTGPSGMLIGAGAGPFFDIGVNSELAPNLSWTRDESTPKLNATNLTYYARVAEDGSPRCEKSPSSNCALMMNVYGSAGVPGPVLRLTARRRTGPRNFTDCIRFALRDHFGDATPISLGGVFAIKKGRAKFHIMPKFPSADQLPFKDPEQLNDWLTYHEFEAPIVALTVMHTLDPTDDSGARLGLRMEHTHCFTTDGSNRAGHLHYDIQGEGIEDVEYEAYINTAQTLYRIDRPAEVLERDLHD